MVGDLGWQAWFTVAVVVATAVALVREMARTDLVLLGSLGVLLLAGVLTPDAAFAGFANSAVLAIAALFVVAAGVERTGVLARLDRVLLPRRGATAGALPRIMGVTSVLSAFLNNTPIVAMLTPRLQAWAREVGLPPSKILIPLSYAAIVGGLVTLIGTSTNIVVSGLLVSYGLPGFGLFELAWVGVPAVLGVLVFMAVFGHRLLPDRRDSTPSFDDGLAECLFELRVAPGSPLAGQTIEEAGLRALVDAFLVHVRREARVVGPVSPREVLLTDDVLVFTGSARALEELLRRPGLERVVPSVAAPYETLPLYEAVVASTSSLAGRTLKEAAFRERYQGVVLAIQRKDVRLDGPLGQTPIRAGDLLVIEAEAGFDRRWNENRHEFYLVAPRERPRTARSRRAPVALAIVGGMVAAIATGRLTLVTAAFTAALAMVVTRCVSGQEARQAVDLSVIVVIVAALGLGQAVEVTGLAGALARAVVAATAGLGPVLVLLALYVLTNVLTELVTHKAAAVLMLPVAVNAARDVGADPRAFAVGIAVAAAASFMTPIGYQTNLMVMAAGGYRFRDYFRVGLPVSFVVMAIAVTMIWLVWL